MTTFQRYTRKFESFEEYETYYEKHDRHEWITDIVENKYTVCADAEYECKTWKTAINRFAEAIMCDFRFNGWRECMLESCENGYFGDKETAWNPVTMENEYVRGGYAWSVEQTMEGFWYVSLVVSK